MTNVLHYPGYDERPLTYGIVQKHAGEIFWLSRGSFVLVIGARRVGRCLEINLDDGRTFLADYGSLIYTRRRKGRRAL